MSAIQMACENRTGVVYVTVAPEAEFLRSELASQLGLDSMVRMDQIALRIRTFLKGKKERSVVVVADVLSRTPPSTV